MMLAVDVVDTPWLQQVPQPRDALGFHEHADVACSHIAFDRNGNHTEAHALRTDFGLDDVMLRTGSDYERVKGAAAWVNARWEHVGDIPTRPTSAVDILRRATRGERFRCVEYGFVLARVLSAYGILCRSLGLRTLDVATRDQGAGHVGTEAYLADERRWVWIDPQFGLTVEYKGQPRSAVELQADLAGGRAVRLSAQRETDVDRYTAIIRPYLVFFDALIPDRHHPGRNWNVTLAPLGLASPAAFQGEPYSGPNRIMTHSRATFYPGTEALST